MTGLRVLASAVFLSLSAWSASAQEGCGDLRTCLQPLAGEVAQILNHEASSSGERLQVSFRPAYMESLGVIIYCRALSMGLRNALNEEVGDVRDRFALNFDARPAPRSRVEPPEVAATWEWERDRAALALEVHVALPEDRERLVSGRIPAAALSRGERACLFSFAAGERRIEAEAPGVLREEPTFRADAEVAEYERGAELRVLGRIEAVDGSGGVWSVVAWRDPVTRERRNLFATGLGGGVDDPPPPSNGLSPGDVFRDCADCPEMVVVPSGSFMMGSPPSEEGRQDYEGPVHRVSIPARFAVGVYEVTRGEFGRFVSSTGRSMGNECWYWKDEWKEGSGRSWLSPGFSQTDLHPAVCVSWDDARAYVDWLSRETGEAYRLLSESEWEYVARAGTTTRYHWGDAIGRNLANCRDCGSRWDFKSTSPVGVFGANAFGLHDVHGNVFEWVEDCWHESYAGAPNDGSAWKGGNCSWHVARGSSWIGYPRYLRAAKRDRNDTGGRHNYVGFRVARTVTP